MTFKVIGILMTYNCERVVQNAIDKIPKDEFDDIICSDDGSIDNTLSIIKKNNIKFIHNNHTGYGGNLFFGMKKAFEMGATHVVELHGDGQYDFNQVNKLKKKFTEGKDLILGNRFYNYSQPFKDGMPVYIYFGNIFLTLLGKIGLGLNLNDFFQGFRGYSKKFFEEIVTDDIPKNYRFSFEVIAKAKFKKLEIDSVPVRCDYKVEHHTAPLSYIIPAIRHTIITCILFRLAKSGIKHTRLFKKK
jgi:glycosyltransferase involved in cell wall biosynthesis